MVVYKLGTILSHNIILDSTCEQHAMVNVDDSRIILTLYWGRTG